MCVAAGHRAEQCVCKCLAHVCFTCTAHQFTYIEKNEGLSMKGCRLLSAADPGLDQDAQRHLQRRRGREAPSRVALGAAHPRGGHVQSAVGECLGAAPGLGLGLT